LLLYTRPATAGGQGHQNPGVSY